MSTETQGVSGVTNSPSATNRRKGHRAYATKTINKVKELLVDFNVRNSSRLHSYKQSLQDKCRVLDELNEEVLSLLTEDQQIGDEIIHASEIKDDIMEIIFEIDSRLNTDTSQTSSSPSLRGTDNHNAKLPKLSLPNFSGNPLEYQGFWDSFNAAVHENTRLEEIMKFNYLKSVLRGSALSSISGLSLTSENYEQAVDILKKRYGNKQLLISSHMDKLLSISPVTSVNDIGKIRNVYDEIEVHVRNLNSLQIDTKQYGPVLISVVMSKVPEQIKLIISRAMPENNAWEVDRLLEILKQEIESRERCRYMSNVTSPKDDRVRRTKSPDDEFTAASLVTDAKREYPITCIYCRRGHSSSRCTVVTDVEARKSILRNKGRCFVCLKSAHIARECKSNNRCFKCNSRHHVSICEPLPRKDESPIDKEEIQRYVSHPVSSYRSSSTFLMTAKATVTDMADVRSTNVRILLDLASQRSFITKEVVNSLKLNAIRNEKNDS